MTKILTNLRGRREVVFRLEHPSDRKGPYRPNDFPLLQTLYGKHNWGIDNFKYGRTPAFHTADLYSGFSSRRDAFKWFQEFIQDLADEQFVLSIYSAEVIWKDNSRNRFSQLLFQRTSALLLSQENL